MHASKKRVYRDNAGVKYFAFGGCVELLELDSCGCISFNDSSLSNRVLER